jgi:uncharacterized protein YndB with AHSA1/START domain
MSIPPPVPDRRCPNCGQPITATAILCPYCGTSVAESVWPPPPSLRTAGITQAAKPIAAGILVSSGVAAVLIGLNDWLVSRTRGGDPILVASDFLLVPLVMGIVCAYFWRTLGMRTSQYFLFSLLNTGVALVVSAFFMAEGVICLMIVSPLILLLTFAGSLLGRALFNRNNRTLNFSIIPLVLLIMVSDSLSKHEYHNSVSDSVVIHARPAEVWRRIAAFPALREQPDYWLFKMGLPYPVEATVSQPPGVGVERRCVFSGNLVFDERITEYVPEKRLTFDIVHQPDHPEIMGHAAVKRGRFVLKDNGDGTTTLIGTSWYELYVYPSWYYDLWARSIARQVHLRVMDHVKAACEEPSGHV